MKELERANPSTILDIIKGGEKCVVKGGVKMPTQGTCDRCGYISSQKLCKVCEQIKCETFFFPSPSRSRERGVEDARIRDLWSLWFACRVKNCVGRVHFLVVHSFVNIVSF